LSVVAAWAIGKMGAKEAIPSLRDSLDSRYRSVQGYSARALATLGDREVSAKLLARFESELDDGLSVAYGSALAKLGVVDAMPELLARLAICDDEAMAGELALARIAGNERSYIQLARSMRSQPGTAVAQSLANARRQLTRPPRQGTELAAKLQVIEEEFARELLDSGARGFGAWIECLPPAWYRQECDSILREASCKLKQHGYSRPEYILLALHTLSEGLVVSTGNTEVARVQDTKPLQS